MTSSEVHWWSQVISIFLYTVVDGLHDLNQKYVWEPCDHCPLVCATKDADWRVSTGLWKTFKHHLWYHSIAHNVFLALDSISLPWPCSEKPGDNRQTTIYIFSWSQHALGQDWAGQNQSPASGSTKAEHQNVKWWTHSIQPPPSPSPSRSSTAHNRFNWAELNNPLLLEIGHIEDHKKTLFSYVNQFSNVKSIFFWVSISFNVSILILDLTENSEKGNNPSEKSLCSKLSLQMVN